jgi:hypothetical protein
MLLINVPAMELSELAWTQAKRGLEPHLIEQQRDIIKGMDYQNINVFVDIDNKPPLNFPAVKKFMRRRRAATFAPARI